MERNGIRITLREVPDDLHLALRLLSVRQRRSLQEIGLEALRQWLERQQAAGGAA